MYKIGARGLWGWYEPEYEKLWERSIIMLSETVHPGFDGEGYDVGWDDMEALLFEMSLPDPRLGGTLHPCVFMDGDMIWVAGVGYLFGSVDRMEYVQFWGKDGPQTPIVVDRNP